MPILPPSEFTFPDPVECDPEGEGLICIGADLSPSTLFEAYSHGLFPWFSEGDPICGGVLNPAALFDRRTIIQANRYYAA
jgi:Leu/Phe-tRNA-protein transferase